MRQAIINDLVTYLKEKIRIGEKPAEGYPAKIGATLEEYEEAKRQVHLSLSQNNSSKMELKMGMSHLMFLGLILLFLFSAIIYVTWLNWHPTDSSTSSAELDSNDMGPAELFESQQ